MTKHPLTLAQIKKLARRYTCDMESGEYSFGEDTVRAAADWQFEEDLRELLRILIKVQKKIGSVDVLDEVYFQFMDKMRPQG